MEIAKSLTNNINPDENYTLENRQNLFLQNSLSKVINAGLNTGIRALLPNFIEEEVISIKDAIINNGFKSGTKQAINSAIEIGKTANGLITGNFENITQVQNAIKSGGMVDTISDILSKTINSLVKNEIINKETGAILKKGKNIIINTVESNIENSLMNQSSSIEKIGEHTLKWKKHYESKDFTNMEKEYSKIKKLLQATLPIEKTLKEARKLENIHLLIKNKGKDFNLSKVELELAQKLVS